MELQFSAGAFVYRKEGNERLFLLLVKGSGEYDLPKGHIEKGETAQIAAMREAKEEAGIDLEIVPFFIGQTRYFFHIRKRKVFKTVKFFIAETKEKRVRISYEHKGYEWANYEQAQRKLKFKDLVQLLHKVNDYITRKEEMDKLNHEYSAMPGKVKGWNLSRNFVPGEGRLDSDVVLLGQAPGNNEDIQRRPFVGRSGQLLTKMLKRARLRRENLYITSIVQFFPPENRIPADNEVELCKSFLKRQLLIIKPKYIILLGNVASAAMLGIKDVSKNHGRFIEKDGIRYFITFHPAAALRFKDVMELMQKDLAQFRTHAYPRSAKQ